MGSFLGGTAYAIKFWKKIGIIQGSPKWVLQLFWWVQTFGLLLFDSMLIFGPSFSHLVNYFGYFLEIHWHFSKLKSKFVHCGNSLLSPRPGVINMLLYIDLHLYSSNCISFCIFSTFYWGRANFNKSDFILVIYVHLFM